MKNLLLQLFIIFLAGFFIKASGQTKVVNTAFKEAIMHPELSVDEHGDWPSYNSKSFSPGYGDAPAWSWKYQFGGTMYDYAQDIVADGNGNVYLTGYFAGDIAIEGNNYSSVGKNDAFVAKFDSLGNLVWLNQFSADNPANEIKAYGICLDASDNVYITGNYTGNVTIGAFSLTNMAVNNLFYVRLNSDGTIINAIQYGGEGETLIGLTIAADLGENVYIMGYTENSEYSRRPSILLKFNAAGTYLWAQYHDESFDDMVVTESGIYFAGSVQSGNDGLFDGSTSVVPPTGYHDIFYAKTDLNGNFEWANILSHESGGDSFEPFLSMDTSENIYMSGRFRTDIIVGGNTLYGANSGFITKFNSTGTIEWAVVIDNISPTGLAADEGNGCFVLCGNTVNYYNTSGVIQGTRALAYSPKSITVDKADHFFTCGSFYGLIYFDKLQEETIEFWNVKFDGNSGTSYIISSVADKQGYTYSYGNISNGADYNGIAVDGGIFFCKQSLDGQVVWLNQFNNTYMGYGGQGNYLNIDTLNNYLYITGVLTDELVIPSQTTHAPIEGGSLILLKYDLNGNYIWSLQEDFNLDVPSVVPDNSGNVIVSGVFRDTITIGGQQLISEGGQDGFIAQYNAAGNLQWAKRAGGESEEYMAITTVDANGNIFLSGEFTSSNVTVDATAITLNEGDGNIIFSKLSSTGDVQWVKSFANSPIGNDGNCWPSGIKADLYGNIYLKGWHGDTVYFDGNLLTSPYTSESKFIVKIDTDGNTLWVNSISEENPGFDYNQFDTDFNGDIYLGIQVKAPLHFGEEYTYWNSGYNDLVVIKYLSSGELAWVKGLPSSGGYNWISSIAVSDTKNVHVSGLLTEALTFDFEELYSPIRHGFVAILEQDLAYKESPVVYYPFNGNANDESGSGFNGTVNEAVLTTDRFGSVDAAYNFDGVDDYINCGTGLNLVNGTDQLTITAWINPEILNSGQNTIISERDGGDNYQFAIMDQSLYFSFWKPDYSEIMIFGNGGVVNEGQWQFVAITYNGSEVDLFYNGELNSSEPASGIINSNSSQLQIGTYTPNGAMFQGSLDDIRIYNKALTAEEIHALYYENGYEPPLPPTTASITFNVNMNYYIKQGFFNPASDFVEVIGTFNEWNGNGAMDDGDGDGYYSQTIDNLNLGEGIDYKFRINATSESYYNIISRYYFVEGDNSIDHLYNNEFESTSIYNIQYSEDSIANSPYLDSVVTVSGIVTASIYNRFWIQDAAGPWNGLLIFNSNMPNIGDSVILTGTVIEYSNKTELSDISEFYTISSGNELLGADTITIDKIDESYESVLVHITNAECTNSDLGYGMWEITDATGTINIDDIIYPYYPIISTHMYAITGIATYIHEEFNVLPRDENDVVDLTGITYATVTFNVNMNYQILMGLFNPAVDYVDLPGSFNNWEGSGPMDDSDADGIYTQNHVLIVDTDIEYKFRTNGDFGQLWDNGDNRMYFVQVDTILDHWFNDDITGEVPIQLSYSVYNEAYEGANDGSIDLHVYGGIPPYSYSWSNGETTEDISNLTLGIYTIVVTDSELDNATTDIEIGLKPNTFSFGDTEISIDGQIESAWGYATLYPIEKPYSGEVFDNAQDLEAYMKVGWNASGLYVLTHVTADDFHVTDGLYGASYQQDMIEVYLDMNVYNLKDGLGASSGIETGHYQIAFLAEPDQVLPAWFTGERGFQLNGDNSYVQELFIPWDNIPSADGEIFKPDGKMPIGLDIAIADNDGEVNGAPRNRLVWMNDGNGPTSTENWFNMDDMGEIVPMYGPNPYKGLYNSNITYERIGVISADHVDYVKELEPVTENICRTYMGLWPDIPLYITINEDASVEVAADSNTWQYPLHNIDWGTSSYDSITKQIHLYYGYTIDGSGERKFEELFTLFSNDTLIVNTPFADEIWYPTWKYGISWIDNMGIPVTIDLYKDSIYVDNIANQIQNTRFYEWIVPKDLETGINYQIGVSMVSSTVVGSFSSPFEIAEEPYEGTVVDYDGNIYSTVKIGNQLWMKENLKTTHYADGTPIYESYVYEDNPDFLNEFGRLYTWNAAMNNSTEQGTQGACPDSYYLATDKDWMTLESELGMPDEELNINGIRGTDQGSQLKEWGSSGFDARLGGFWFQPNNAYYYLGTGYYWTATESDANQAIYRGLGDHEQVARWIDGSKLDAMSIRCLKAPDSAFVVLNVDMSKPIADGDFIEGTDTLFLAGSMDGWNMPGTNMDMQMFESATNDIYTISGTLPAGHYEYKYFKNAGWDYGEWGGEPNRFFDLDTIDLVINDIWGPEAIKPITELNISNTLIPHNIYPGHFIASIAPVQEQSFPAFDFVYSYTLIAGEGDADNNLFMLNGDSLLCNAWLNINEQNSFTLRLQVFDGISNYFEKIIILNLVKSDWKNQFTNLAGGIDEIYIIDENTVWAMDQQGAMARTTNGGETWSDIAFLSADNFSMGAFFAINANVAWRIVSYANSGLNDSTGIYKTIDGGKTWTLHPDIFHEPGAFPNFVHFWNENEGFCAGDGNLLYTTSDGGTTWIPSETVPDLTIYQYNSATTYSVVGDTLWYIFNTIVCRSVDRGKNWKSFDAGVEALRIAFKNSMEGLLIPRASGTLYSTADGGETWSANVEQPDLRTFVIKYDTYSQRYIATGRTFDGSDPYGISYSYDDGNTWQNDTAFFFEQTTIGISWHASNIAWVGGFQGNIFKYVGMDEVNTNPTANFEYLVEGNEVSFINLSLNADAFNWTFGDGAQSELAEPVHTYSNTGFYDVCLTVFNAISGKSSEYCNEIAVGDTTLLCKAEFVYEIFGDSVVFTNTSISEFTNYSWNFGDGMFSTEASPVHTYTEGGYFVVSFSAYDSNSYCYDEVFTEILIELGGQASCLADFKVLTNGGNAKFINQSLGNYTDVLWAFGDGTFVSATAGDTIDHTYTTSDYYEVCLMVYDSVSGCLDEYCKEILITLDDVVVCKADYTYFVDGATVSFSSAEQGNITNFMWDFDNGDFSFEENPVYTYTQPGFYNVEFTVLDSASNCLSSKNKVIVITEVNAPFCQAAFEVFIDENNVVFNNTSQGEYTDVFWDYGDGNFSTQDDSVHVYATPDYYEVVLTIYNSETECIDEFTKVVMVTSQGAPLCDAQFSYFSNNNILTFNNESLGAATDYFWDFGDGTYSFDENPQHTYSESGYFEVNLTTHDTVSDCLDEKTKVVFVYNPVVAACNAKFTFYPQEYTVSFTSEATGDYSWHFWDFNDGTNSNKKNPVHTYTEPGYYEVAYSVIDTSNGCFDTRYKVVFVEGATGSGTSTTALKAKYSYVPSSNSNKVVFNDESLGNIADWYWDFGDNTPAVTIQNPVYTYDTNDYYRVCLTINNDTKQASKCKFIAVGDVSNSSTAFFTYFADSVTSTGHFKNKSLGNIVEHYWDFGDGYTSIQKSPSHTYADTGYYAVCLTTTSAVGVQKTYCKDVRIGAALDNPCLFSCVWPGDANNDLEANHYDIMTIGLNYNLKGPKREDATTGWYGQFAQNWSTYQLDGTNNKYGDANGDGVINFDDVSAIEQNFASSHYEQPDVKSALWNISCVWDSTNSKAAGSRSRAKAQLSPPRKSKAGEIYAIAYEIEVIGGEKIKWDSVLVDFDISWIGKDGESMLTVTEMDTTQYIIYIGMTRIDKQDVTGSGTIAEISFKFKDDVDESGVSFNVTTKGGIISDGEDVPVDGTIELALSSPVEICQGETAVLNAGSGFDSYAWSTGVADTTSTVTVSTAGIYVVTVTDESGASASDTIELIVNEVPTVNLGSDLVQDGSVELDAGSGYASYLWSTDSDQQKITVSQSGDYWVRVSNASGCFAYDTVNVTITGLNDIMSENITVFPNPVSTDLIVESNQNISKLELFNLAGQLIYVIEDLGSLKTSIAMEDYEQGTYLLSVTDTLGNVQIVKVFKN